MPVAAAVASVLVSAAAAKKQSDATKKAAQSQAGENQANRDYIERQTAEARADINRLYPQVQQYRQGGHQGALQALQGAMPEQARLLNQGATAAHSQLLAGMPQFQNAILGAPVDYSAFQQPAPMTPDFSWLSGARLPELPAPAAPQGSQAQMPVGIDPRQLPGVFRDSRLGLGGLANFDKFGQQFGQMDYATSVFDR